MNPTTLAQLQLQILTFCIGVLTTLWVILESNWLTTQIVQSKYRTEKKRARKLGKQLSDSKVNVQRVKTLLRS